MFKGRPTQIDSRLDSYDLFQRVLGHSFKVGVPFSSPFREDKHPSFIIQISAQGNLYFQDYRTGDYGDWFDLYKIMYGGTYIDAITFINSGVATAQKRTPEEIKLIPKERAEIFTDALEYNEGLLEYWRLYGISLSTLRSFNVNPISRYAIKRYGRVKGPYQVIGYCYNFENNYKKLLFPKSLGNKWISNGPAIEGISQLDEGGETLIITKSLKDVMVLYELDYNSISPPSEGYNIPAELMVSLSKRYNNIYLLYDNDQAGIDAAETITNKYPFLRKVFMDTNMGKDISDIAKTHGLEIASEVLYQKLQNAKAKE